MRWSGTGCRTVCSKCLLFIVYRLPALPTVLFDCAIQCTVHRPIQRPEPIFRSASGYMAKTTSLRADSARTHTHMFAYSIVNCIIIFLRLFIYTKAILYGSCLRQTKAEPCVRCGWGAQMKNSRYEQRTSERFTQIKYAINSNCVQTKQFCEYIAKVTMRVRCVRAR